MALDFYVPQYRTIDADDATELAYDEALEVLTSLEFVTNLTAHQKEFAAEYIGQTVLDGLANVETQRIADDLSSVIAGVGKPYLVMVAKPEYIGGYSG